MLWYIKIYFLLFFLILLINITIIIYNDQISIVILSISCLMWIFISLFILAKFINCKLNEEYTQNEQNNTTTIQIVEFLPIYSQQLKRQSNLSLQSDVPSYKSFGELELCSVSI